MNKINFYKHIIICIIIIYEAKLVESINDLKIEQKVESLKPIGIVNFDVLKKSSGNNIIKPVELDININKSTNQFDCVKDVMNQITIYNQKMVYFTPLKKIDAF